MDFVSEDGSRVVEILDQGPTQIRELRSRLAGLGTHLARNHRVAEACLLLRVERLTEERLRNEWNDLIAILRPAIARRLALIAVGPDLQVCLPKRTPELGALADAAGEILEPPVRPGGSTLPKYYDILQVLLIRWLLGQGPISRKELGEVTGCTYPTIAKAVRRLPQHVLRLHSNRSLDFTDFPLRAWDELRVRSGSERGTLWFMDGTGRDADPQWLLKRLQRMKPPHVALGGVLAGEHWDPHFNLIGIPRLDISIHAAHGCDLSFLRALDPALQPARPGEVGPVLVIHPIRRPVSLFAEDPKGGLPFADPIETLLDVCEMRYAEQADEMVEHFRRQRDAAIAARSVRP